MVYYYQDTSFIKPNCNLKLIETYKFHSNFIFHVTIYQIYLVRTTPHHLFDAEIAFASCIDANDFNQQVPLDADPSVIEAHAKCVQLKF